MKTDLNQLETSEAYHNLNKSHSRDTYKTRLYTTGAIALYDVVFSLLQFLSHKTKIGVVRKGHSVIEKMIPQFLRIQTPIQSPEIGQNIFSFLQAIDKETNFVLWSSENEITGEYLYSDADCLEIHKQLSAKRIFSIQIFNRKRNFPYQDFLKNNYAILVESDDLFQLRPIVAFYTEKFKAPSLIGPFQDINALIGLVNLQKHEGQALQSFSEADWERIGNTLSKQSYFKKFSSTLGQTKDRYVFSDEAISGERLKQALIEQGVAAENLFAPSSLPTWQLDTWKNWWSEAENEKFIRGLLIISEQAFVHNTNLAELISKSVQKIAQDSQFL